MPETPLPQPLVQDPELSAGAEASRLRRRSTEPDTRPVSALAPARPSLAASASGSLTSVDADFVSALHEAGVASELDGNELVRAASYIDSEEPAARRLDLLLAYYDADGDPIRSQRRQATDRWFVYGCDEGLTAAGLVQRISGVTPELEGTRLERIGGSEGALVLRCGEHVCALEDERDDAPAPVSVSVHGIVRAFNVLLDRHGVRTRLVGLLGDGRREAYFGLSTMGAAINLANADYLTSGDGEELMHHAAW